MSEVEVPRCGRSINERIQNQDVHEKCKIPIQWSESGCPKKYASFVTKIIIVTSDYQCIRRFLSTPLIILFGVESLTQMWWMGWHIHSTRFKQNQIEVHIEIGFNQVRPKSASSNIKL